MTSYTPTRCSGTWLRISSWCMWMFEGSHSRGGQFAMSISKPSSWVVGGNVLARSMSQILKKESKDQRAVIEHRRDHELRASYPVPVPISAILRLGLERGMLG